MPFRDSKGFITKKTLKSYLLKILDSYLTVADRKKIKTLMTFFLTNVVIEIVLYGYVYSYLQQILTFTI